MPYYHSQRYLEPSLRSYCQFAVMILPEAIADVNIVKRLITFNSLSVYIKTLKRQPACRDSGEVRLYENFIILNSFIVYFKYIYIFIIYYYTKFLINI